MCLLNFKITITFNNTLKNSFYIAIQTIHLFIIPDYYTFCHPDLSFCHPDLSFCHPDLSFCHPDRSGGISNIILTNPVPPDLPALSEVEWVILSLTGNPRPNGCSSGRAEKNRNKHPTKTRSLFS